MENDLTACKFYQFNLLVGELSAVSGCLHAGWIMVILSVDLQFSMKFSPEEKQIKP